ncbi:LysR family transcriptional regulator [Rhizobium leguminosarum]|uniref:LysR substrate-binding domain-containing protein n=1 Tax=Rhizobium leguminosarum TaxID=384 RepID=UPI000FEC623F|nr:LysR family transcriptional regulator [Rhizobium leguminosarum]RWX12885.1 LysR family transcriptional regulator [Rhizobium leguminosarum]
MSIEMRHLRYVVAAAEHGSFRRAARALGVQASAVSRRIADLEDEIGATLFVRCAGGVALTFAGQRFIRRAGTALRQVSEAEVEVGTVGRGAEGIVRIGLFVSLASGFVADLIQAFAEAHPRVRLDFVDGGHAEHVAAIRQNRLDIAFMAGAILVEDCESAHLSNERIYVVMPQHDELAAKHEIEWRDLRDREFIVGTVQPGPDMYRCLVAYLSRAGHAPNVRQQAVQRDTLIQLIARGNALTLTAESSLGAEFSGVVYRAIANEVIPLQAIWSVSNSNPPFRRLLSLAKRRVAHSAGRRDIFARWASGSGNEGNPSKMAHADIDSSGLVSPTNDECSKAPARCSE